MYPDLVRTSGSGRHIEEGVLLVALAHGVPGLGVSSMLHDGHTLSVGRVAADGCGDATATGGEIAFDERCVHFCDLVVPYLASDVLLSGRMLCDHQQSRRVFVQP